MSKDIVITVRCDGQVNLSLPENIGDVEVFGALKMAMMQMEMVLSMRMAGAVRDKINSETEEVKP